MTPKEYKKELLNYLDKVVKFHPQKVIVYTKNMFFLITPELQEWTGQTTFPVALEVGLNKSASVVNQEIMKQVSIEQTTDKNEGDKFLNRYFEDEEKAKEWILS